MTKRICLIDGSGYIFRAFYALPPMTAPDGTPVNAVYGFTNMFFKLTNSIKCDYSLVLFDAKRANFRNDIYPDYKANRAETPPELIPQFPIIREAVSALNLNYLEMEGFEADDLIATYAKLALAQGCEVIVVSADKDLMQLIRPGVTYYDPMKDKFFEDKDVVEKFGVTPDKVIDVQALMGDSSDNIPGVPGVGPKTAAELINQFGSLENLLGNLDDIKQEKRRQTLKDNVDNARISYQLATLKTDVPVDKNLDDFRCKKPNLAQVKTFIDTYAMKSLYSRAENWVNKQCSENPQESSPFQGGVRGGHQQIIKKYELIQDEPTLKKWAETILQTRLFAFDTETTGFSPTFDKIVGISLATSPGIACYVPLNHKSGDDSNDLFSAPKAIKQLSYEVVKKHLRPLFASKSILKIGHNIKFDMHFISQVLDDDFTIEPIDDTAVISYVLDSSNHGHSLDELAGLFLDYKTIKYEDVTGTGKNKITFDHVELDKALDYAAEDADITLRLYNLLKPRLVSEGMTGIYEHFDRPLINTLREMEDVGIEVDVKQLNTLKKEFEAKLVDIEKEVYTLAGEEFNLASPKQVGDILSKVLNIKGKKTATGAMQTGAAELEKMAEEHELPRKILDWRGFAKLKSTYTDSLLELVNGHNRVHTTYNQTFVNTGRLSSNNPNLQNIPIRSTEGKKIRACFIPREGCKLISADYSQVELRLMAVVANVKALKEAFQNGIDIHTATASQVFGVPVDKVDSNLRRDAKAINFGIIYGISQYGLAKNIGTTPEAAKAYIDAYFAKMPEIKTFMDTTIDFAHKHGYVITPFGRKIAINGINDQNKRVSSFAERAAINAPLQGGAADIMKLAMNRMQERLKNSVFKTRMLLQVHDELVFEAPLDEVDQIIHLAKEVMEGVVNFDINFTAEVGIGDNWEQAH